MFHTILNPDEVFAVFPDGESVSQGEIICRGGRIFEGTKSNGRFVIGRMISTDPMDYLDPRYFPGKSIF